MPPYKNGLGLPTYNSRPSQCFLSGIPVYLQVRLHRRVRPRAGTAIKRRIFGGPHTACRPSGTRGGLNSSNRARHLCLAPDCVPAKRLERWPQSTSRHGGGTTFALLAAARNLRRHRPAHLPISEALSPGLLMAVAAGPARGYSCGDVAVGCCGACGCGGADVGGAWLSFSGD